MVPYRIPDNSFVDHALPPLVARPACSSSDIPHSGASTPMHQSNASEFPSSLCSKQEHSRILFSEVHASMRGQTVGDVCTPTPKVVFGTMLGAMLRPLLWQPLR